MCVFDRIWLSMFRLYLNNALEKTHCACMRIPKVFDAQRN